MAELIEVEEEIESTRVLISGLSRKLDRLDGLLGKVRLQELTKDLNSLRGLPLVELLELLNQLAQSRKRGGSD